VEQDDQKYLPSGCERDDRQIVVREGDQEQRTIDAKVYGAIGEVERAMYLLRRKQPKVAHISLDGFIYSSILRGFYSQESIFFSGLLATSPACLYPCTLA
jgi:hypothetical protein